MGYADAFLTERPQDGLDAVQTRLKRAKVLHDQFANYFKERAHIEDVYAKSITKAFQKHFVTDPKALGTFAAPWEKLSAETVELATLHGQLSLRISTEIERPLRDFVRTDGQWQNLPIAEANCMRIAREFDEKQSKVNKYKKAVEKAPGRKVDAAEQKLMEYTKQLENTRTAWMLEGPVILQKYQAVDEARLSHLKEIVSSFEAIQTEIALQIVEMSGVTSSSVTEFEPIMDIELYSSELATNLHPVDRHETDSAMSSDGRSVRADTLSRTNGSHLRQHTAGSHMSNVSYSTDHSYAQSKGTSLEQPRSVDNHYEAPGSVVNHSGALLSAVDLAAGSNAPAASTTSTNGDGRVDADGFTIPPADNSPWSEAGLSSGNGAYDDERSETSSFSQGPSKMQMEIRTETVAESNEEARAAMERVASTLKATNTISRKPRGRREIRSIYQSSDDSTNAYNAFQGSPLSATFTADSLNAPPSSSGSNSGNGATPPAFASPGSRAFFNSHPNMTAGQPPLPFTPTSNRANTISVFGMPGIDTHTPTGSNSHPLSVVSTPTRATTLPSPTGAHMEHGSQEPLPQERELVATVVEKINIYSQGGEISKMLLTGEVSLNYEGLAMVPRETRATLHLGNMSSLEKCVPNPGFVTMDVNADGNVEQSSFTVDLSALAFAGGRNVTVLKYQVRLDESHRTSLVPLLVHPAWKCEPNQTSLLINYKANSQCKLVTGTLTEVSFLVPVSGEVLNVQSRPTGIWNQEAGKILWDADNVMFSQTPEPQKLLARFDLNAAQGPSQPATTAAKFKIFGQLLSDLQVSLSAPTAESSGQSDQVVPEGEEVAEGSLSTASELASSTIKIGSVRLQVQSGRYLSHM